MKGFERRFVTSPRIWVPPVSVSFFKVILTMFLPGEYGKLRYMSISSSGRKRSDFFSSFPS